MDEVNHFKNEQSIKARMSNVIGKIFVKVFHQPIRERERLFLSDFSVVSVWMLITSIGHLVLMMFAGRVLGVVGFGQYHVLLAVVQIMGIPMLFGLHTTATKYISEVDTERQKREIMTITSFSALSLIALFAVIYWLLRDYIAKSIDVPPDIVKYAIVFAVVLSIFYFTRSLLQGWKKLRQSAFYETISLVSTAILFFGGVHYYLTEVSFLTLLKAYMIGYAVFIALASVRLVAFLGRIQIRITTVKKLFMYSALAILGSISSVLLGSIDKLILGVMLDAKTVGIYSAYIFASTMVFARLVYIFITVFFPYASATKQKDQLIHKVNTICLYGFFIVFCSAPVLIVFVINFMGREFELSALYVILFSLNVATMVVYQIKMWLLNAEGIAGVSITVRGLLVAGIFNIILNILLIPLVGILGAILSTTIINALLYVYFSHYATKLFCSK